MLSPPRLPRPAGRPPALAWAAAALVAGLAAGASARAEDPPAPPAVALDYDFYKARVAPIVHRVCAECHADPRKRLGRHFLRPVQGRAPRESDHERNFEVLGKLITPGDPSRSPWLLKPLGPRQGGVEHKGGEKIRFDSIEYATMVEFINGARLESPRPQAPTSEGPARAPEVPREGLSVEAEDFAREGEASAVPHEGAQGLVVRAGAGGVRLTHAFRVPEARAYRLTFRALGGPGAFSFRVDGGPAREVRVEEPGFSVVGSPAPCDGAEPLVAPRGDLAVEEGALRMKGRSTEAALWLAPWGEPHEAVEATFRLPPEEEGGDDAFLLFDMKDAANGKYVGLSDGGRRFVIGVLEGGRLRGLDSAEAPPGEAERAVRVEYVEGVAVGRLDGRPLVRANLDAHLPGDGRFGALTHGEAVVTRAAAIGQYELHRARFELRPVVALPAGAHTLTVELGAGSLALDAVLWKEEAP